MKYAVIGAGYGDEGKGLMVDYLCEKLGNKPLVVRFNGGPQAAHTVQRDDLRHVFHSFGSGSLLGCPTYLDSQVLINPTLINEEALALDFPKLYIHENCQVITPYDIMWNHYKSINTQSSCGMGIFSTVTRSKVVPFTLTSSPHVLNDIVDYYLDLVDMEEDSPFKNYITDVLEDAYYNYTFHYSALDNMKYTLVDELPKASDYVFEGAQGLLLDEKYGEMPYCTPSNTGLENIRKYEIDEAIYVTRCYQTRHGAGPLPGEYPAVSARMTDLTNKYNDFQGSFRYGPLNIVKLLCTISEDSAGSQFSLAITCLDQVDSIVTLNNTYPKELFLNWFDPRFVSYGPSAKDVVRRY